MPSRLRQGKQAFIRAVKFSSAILPKDGLLTAKQAESIRIAYELYKEPSTSLRDVIEYYKEHDIYTLSTTRVNGEPKENMDRSHVSRILESPLYVRADKEVYAFFVSKGYEILDDIEAYDGVHGVFIHRSSGTTFVKIGYHEGLVDAETWLAVQDKKSHNRRIPNNGSSNVSWLVGLLKCKIISRLLILIIRQGQSGGSISWIMAHTARRAV